MSALPPLSRRDLLALGALIKVPTALETKAPARGQVWRARWDGSVALLVVLGVEAAMVDAAPLFFDFDPSEFDNEEFVDVTGHRALVLRRHVLRVADVTLDALFGEVELRDHVPVSRDVDDDVEHAMLAPLRQIAEWSGDDVGDGSARDLLLANGMTPSTLAESIGVPLAAALRILRSELPVTPEQAEAISKATALSADDILRGNPSLPSAWREEMHFQVHRAGILELARRDRLSDSEAWLEVAYGAYGLAARQSDRDSGAGFRVKIQSYLQSILHERG